MVRDEKIWQCAINENTVGALNEALIAGFGPRLIQLSEVLHARQFTLIADEIARRVDAKLCLIAGPSSSGKTTTSKRLALHLASIGITPIVIAMDNYFKNREDTPRDEKGEYDFECLEALDVPFLNQQLRQLFAGEEVEIPDYDFVLGQRVFRGKKVQMTPGSIIVMEGIHGLNPGLTPEIAPENKFSIYASVLRSLTIRKPNDSVYDTRLLRRMVRDNQFRGNGPADTILRWPSVRAGEEKNIVPYMDLADMKFDSSLIYELPLFKSYAENLLRSVPRRSPAYEEAQRLLDFILTKVAALTPKEAGFIPPTSILREFIGGSSFRY
ncbi:MAG: nucleoside kinase [Bacteroidales bacterium]|nr:nucleoside kinase [Bacteroidales bacterium]